MLVVDEGKVMKGKVGEGWEKERSEFFEGRGIKREEMVKIIEELEEGEMWYGQLEKRKKEMQREERWEKIRKLKYNKWYSGLKGRGSQST